MSESETYPVGRIVSADLTVPDAERVRDFYQGVIGWEPEGLEMLDEQGSYTDYVMKDAAGNWVGGVCHRRGLNADLPPVWLVYIQVADIEASLERCVDSGGRVLKLSRTAEGLAEYAVIEDPAGAVLAITRET